MYVQEVKFKLNSRIKSIRQHPNINLSQEAFGKRIGITGAAISRLENGDRNITDQVIHAICLEFNVNENWLRTGEGEMFAPLDREQEIAKMTLDLLKEEKDSFKFRLIKALMNLSPEKWALLEDIACEIAQKKD